MNSKTLLNFGIRDEWLFAQSPVGNAYVPTGLDAAYARFLQDRAHRAVIKEQVTATSGMIR